ncbi:hypothetical protein ACFO1B_27065 [Dactylosporangium siamense]|uniref:Uncharacterized protein n=1 Tax=Dactylosporangium siamense TaxID=685454 RepID=A0A919UCJ9_9ACTN|nr:hypothetical protein [Dactylosporangium siamense]GIG46675.1 hypothetical protein Dsi01nite_047160 [Dactylosporangium siamense]
MFGLALVLGMGLVVAISPAAAAAPVDVAAPAAGAGSSGRAALAGGAGSSGRIQFSRLEEDDFETQCLATPSAAVDPGWFPDRFAQCRRGTGIHDVFDADNVKVGEVHVSLIIMGFAVDGDR